ncbi:hypothetical protein KR009_007953 [Drosophila setifemur]|nr:hypothetical protein KR009_007953 [Drosophila setifemur]
MFYAGRWLLLGLMVNAISWTYSARILLVDPFELQSQCLLMTPYIQALAERGHQMTVIHAYEHCMIIPGVAYIRITDNNNVGTDYEEFIIVHSHTKNQWGETLSMAKIMVKASLNVLNNPEVRSLMNSNTTFDLVVVEPGYTDILFGLAAQFQAPLVGLSTCGADWNVNALMAHGSSVMVEPIVPLPSYTDSLWNRLYNWYFITEEWLLMELVFLPKMKLVYDHFFGHLEQSFWEIRHSFSLILLNQHFSMFHARPSGPGLVEVAGFHIPRETPKLPEDLQLFIDKAEFGVIYFAMGMDLQSKDLPEETQKMLLDCFKSMPQRVVWKFEAEPLADLPPNVYLAKYMPQQAILAHPKVRLFISHGGMLSVIEGVHYGKPLLGMPLFFDQFRNFEYLLNEEMALVVNLNTLTGEELKVNMERLLYEPSFRTNALALSQRLQDQPMHPLDTAVYWTEYIIRYKGADHLKVSLKHINLMEYYYLDKYLMIGVRLSLVVGFVFLVLSKGRSSLTHLARFAKPFLPSVGTRNLNE